MTASGTAEAAGGGGLLIRMWTEPGARDIMRARVLTFQGNEEPSTWATAAGAAAVLEAVERWLLEQVRAADATASASVASAASP
jgi:hypothetical protein